MTLLDALRHQWTQQWRSTNWGRNLVTTIFLAIAAVYFGVLFVGLGWFYPDVVAEMTPERDPLRLLNAYLLHGMVMLTVGRFVLQRSAGSAVRPYRSLPIPKGRLTRLLQVTSALSLFNLLPLVLLGALGASTVGPSASAVGMAYWATGVLLVLILSQFANSLLRVAWDRNPSVVLGTAVLFAAGLGLDALGLGSLRLASAWCFDGLSTGRPLPLIVLATGAVAAGWAAHQALRTRLYAVGEETSTGARVTPRLTGLRELGLKGQTASLVQLSIMLILRNKRPRQMLLLNVPLTIGLVVFMGPQLSGDPFLEMLFGFLLTASLASPYFQFGGLAWHGNHFDVLLARPPIPRTLIQSQFALFAGLCLCSVLTVLPIVAWQAPGLLDTLAALLLYNLGVSAPAFLLLGTWNRTALAVNQTAFFNHQGNTSLAMISIAALITLPLTLFFGVGLEPALWILAGLGLLGLGTAPIWMRGLGRLLHRQRYTLAAGFRATDL